MKRIVFELTDEAYKALNQALLVRKLAGMTWGAPEQALGKILDSLGRGEEVVTLRSRHDKD
jgi:hypothetical protein